MSGATKPVDWDALNEKLPFEKTKAQKKRRKQMFKDFDPNGNGYLSLAETEKGVRDILRCDDLFDAKPAIHRSFHYAKKASSGGKKKLGDGYLEFVEFRLFLQTLRQYFEYYQAFERIDTGDDGRISKKEFCSEKMKPTIEKWTGPINDMEAEFDKIDADGGGQVLFKEFILWCLTNNLDLSDDEDSDDE